MGWFWLALLGCGSAEPEVDPCEDAWAQMNALKEQIAQSSGLPPRAPTEQAFKEACGALPEELRPCFSPAYAVENPDCREGFQELPRAERDKVESLLAPPDPSPDEDAPGDGDDEEP